MYRTDKQFMTNPTTSACRVYVGALPKTTTPQDLEQKFQVHGKILGINLQSGFAFIQYENEAQAQSAIQTEHQTMIYGRKIIVKQALEKRDKGQLQNKKGGANQQNQYGKNQQNRFGGPNQQHNKFPQNQPPSLFQQNQPPSLFQNQGPNQFQQNQPQNQFQQNQGPNQFQQNQPPSLFQQNQPPNQFQQNQPPKQFQQNAPHNQFQPNQGGPNQFQQNQGPNHYQQNQPSNQYQQNQPSNQFQQNQPPNQFQQNQPPNNQFPQNQPQQNQAPNQFQQGAPNPPAPKQPPSNQSFDEPMNEPPKEENQAQPLPEDDSPQQQEPPQGGPTQQQQQQPQPPSLMPPQHDGPPPHDKRNRKRKMRDRDRDRDRDRFPPRDDYYDRDDNYPPVGYSAPPIMDQPPPSERNDCEIIVVSKLLTKYAEYIEQRLKNLGLIVDLLFPNEDVPIGKVLANISSRGCLYAILVMPQNEEQRSLTLNILHGIPQEHRNMPLEDSLILITRNFDAYMRGDKIVVENQAPGQMTISDRHPTAMQLILNLVAENRQLSTSQYDKLIKYLQERRELQAQHEVAEGVEQESQESNSKQTELQNRIMNILNKSETTQSTTANEPAESPTTPAPLLKDPSVQKALDSLLGGDMFKNIAAAI